jgi:hypothetical protein
LGYYDNSRTSIRPQVTINATGDIAAEGGVVTEDAIRNALARGVGGDVYSADQHPG